ncbi:MAG: hypothetical protein FVQ80_16880 [Planctomycetes bacterium]|nr:hypothetical protein [Planctomycetota bacterium]
MPEHFWKSLLADKMQEYINIKKIAGFKFKIEYRWMERYDDHCLANGYDAERSMCKEVMGFWFCFGHRFSNTYIGINIVVTKILRKHAENFFYVVSNAALLVVYPINKCFTRCRGRLYTYKDAKGYSKEEIIGEFIFEMYAIESAKYAKEKVFPAFAKTGTKEMKSFN